MNPRFLGLVTLSAGLHALLFWIMVWDVDAVPMLARGQACAEGLEGSVGFVLPQGAENGERTTESPTDEQPIPSDEQPEALPQTTDLPAPGEPSPMESVPERVVAVQELAFIEPLPLPVETAPEAIPKPKESEQPAVERKPVENPKAVAKTAKVPVGTPFSRSPASGQGSEGVTSEASLAGDARPTYPREAQLQGLEGRVVLSIRVAADGSVAEATIERSSGYQILDDAALRFGRSITFRPARKGKTAVATEVLLPVRFRLY
ncbi:MAG: energy transducer TonB [Gemmataceae bacterium]|nr:energy transducer TonB [Gemmataceae bacterium]